MEKLLSLSKASTLLGVTTRCLRYWDEAGKIKVVRTEGGHRRIPISEIERIQGSKEVTKNKTLVYARVSTNKQQENLERQIGRLLEYCTNENWDLELHKDIGSGLNDKRKGFNKLLKRIAEEDVQRIVVEYKDRLTRFGFSMFEKYCEQFGVEIIILQQKENKDFEQEFSEDVIALVACFSAKLYGRRGGRKK
jgi:putative resolvase